MHRLQARNIRYLISIVAIIFTLQICEVFGQTDSTDTSYSYQQLLQSAEKYIVEGNLKQAFIKLDLAYSVVEKKPNFFYYFLLGEANLKIENPFEAVKNFEESLRLKPAQPNLSYKVYQLLLSEKKYPQALKNLKIYLNANPNPSREICYRALILASGCGDDVLRKEMVDKLNEDHKYKRDLKFIINRIHTMSEKKHWQPLKEEVDKYLYFFPFSMEIHKARLLLSEMKSNKGREDILAEMAAVFKNYPEVSMMYGIFLKENRRYKEALSLMRRAFFLEMMQKGVAMDLLPLYQIRNLYFAINASSDFHAIDGLTEALRHKNGEEKTYLESLYNQYRKNRELLIFLVYIMSEKGDIAKYEEYSEILRKRDEEMDWKEMNTVRTIFSTENLSFEKERKYYGKNY